MLDDFDEDPNTPPPCMLAHPAQSSQALDIDGSW